MARIVPASEEWIRTAAEVIRAGGLVAFPTETVYGLGANALDPEAVARIFAVKGRPPSNPVIVHIAGTDQFGTIADHSNAFVERLAHEFWPGPITVVLPKRNTVPPIVTAGGETIGIRIPNHPVALALLRAAAVPIAAPSANRSESVSPTTAEHVASSLGDAVDLILDGGPCSVGLESTVLDLTSNPPTILRPGAITAEQIERAIGARPAVRDIHASTGGTLRSPGQMKRHYAPAAPLWISENAITDAGWKPLTGVITHEHAAANFTTLPTPIPGVVRTKDRLIHILPDDPAGYARYLYTAIRELDQSGVNLILVQAVPDTDEWLAIRDRLSRAAAPKTILHRDKRKT